MKWFQNAPTRTKLLTGFGLMMLLLVAVFVTAYFAITALLESQRRIFNNNFSETLDAVSFDANEGDIRAAMLTMVNTTNRAEIDQLRNLIDQKSVQANELLRRLLDQNRDRPKTLQQLETWRAIRDAYKQTREQQVIPAALEGNVEQARGLMHGIQSERFNQMRAITTK
ncbi:MAG TPA: MCP four helix bundle domain-containing protein, partial [Candidatus Sulfotelmatobacter sp.]|nr:MCP four helix bundle domain-containing protein [Candidatus Sulfotelmatobacter sp.]